MLVNFDSTAIKTGVTAEVEEFPVSSSISKILELTEDPTEILLGDRGVFYQRCSPFKIALGGFNEVVPQVDSKELDVDLSLRLHS